VGDVQARPPESRHEERSSAGGVGPQEG
jgi:hypothetical protein